MAEHHGDVSICLPVSDDRLVDTKLGGLVEARVEIVEHILLVVRVRRFECHGVGGEDRGTLWPNVDGERWP